MQRLQHWIPMGISQHVPWPSHAGLPSRRVRIHSLPLRSTHQQYPDVAWHWTFSYPPSSPHVGMNEPAFTSEAWDRISLQAVGVSTENDRLELITAFELIQMAKPQYTAPLFSCAARGKISIRLTASVGN